MPSAVKLFLIHHKFPLLYRSPFMNTITANPIAEPTKTNAAILSFLWLHAVTGVCIWLYLFFKFIRSDAYLQSGSQTASFFVHGEKNPESG